MKNIIKGLIFICIAFALAIFISSILFKILAWAMFISFYIKIVIIGVILVVVSYYIGKILG